MPQGEKKTMNQKTLRFAIPQEPIDLLEASSPSGQNDSRFCNQSLLTRIFSCGIYGSSSRGEDTDDMELVVRSPARMVALTADGMKDLFKYGK